MQAVLLAAGKSSRFYPFNISHKSSLVLLGKPIIEHTLLSVRKAGITDVVVVVSTDGVIKHLLGDGNRLGLSITYVVQEEPCGMGDALLMAKAYVHDDFFLLHAHHVDFHDFSSLLREKKTTKDDVILLAKEKESLGRFGALKIEEDRVVEVREKPAKGEEPSKFGVVGIYLLPKEFLTTLKKISREEYSFEKALSEYAKEAIVKMVEAKSEVISLKYPWDMLQLSRYLLTKQKRYISPNATISENAIVMGDVVIDDGATVMEQTTIKGPCYIGKNTYIGTKVLLRNYVSIEEHVVIGANMEVKNSVIFSDTTTHSGFIGDSVIGKKCKISAFFCTANVRIDRKNIKLQTQNGKVDTFLKSFGVIMGDSVSVGIRVSSMPGILIGGNTTIGPSTTIMKNIEENVEYFTKFKETVIRKKTDKKLVLFDIDYTLFDVSYFDKHFHKRLSDLFNEDESYIHKTSIDIIVDLVTKEEYLNIDAYITRLLKILGRESFRKQVENILFGSLFFKKGFYQEVEKTLFEIKKIARIGIFSQGDKKFQWAKISQSGFEHLFDKDAMYIVKPKKLDFLPELKKRHRGEAIYLVEDKPSVIKAVKEFMPSVYTIWMKRGKYANEADRLIGFTPNATVTTLDQTIDIISKHEIENI